MRTQRLTITELEQIRQRAEAATEGDWDYDLVDGGVSNGNYMVIDTELDSEGYPVVWAKKADLEFICEARESVPKLVTEVETLITEKAAARRMLDELIGEMANASEAGYALAPETLREDLEKIRKELIDHGE